VFRELNKFLTSSEFGYLSWLIELSRQERTFSALSISETDFNRMVADKQIETGFLNKGLHQGSFVKELNRAAESVSEKDPFKATIRAFEAATNTLVQEKLKYS
jgi:hypothetical protein